MTSSDRGVLSIQTLDALIREAERAHLKHKDHGGSLLDPALGTMERLAALVEEVGEVARALTYDNNKGIDHLMTELNQVANVAATWYEFLLREKQANYPAPAPFDLND